MTEPNVVRTTFMNGKLSGQQIAVFLEAMTLGIACGLQTPFEWYLNYTTDEMPYDNDSYSRYRLVTSAFAEIFRLSASCTEEEEQLGAMEDADVIRMFSTW